MKKITKQHRTWLLNVKNSTDYKIPFDYMGITGKRIEILFDMELVEYTNINEWGIYKLSEKGINELKKLKRKNKN